MARMRQLFPDKSWQATSCGVQIRMIGLNGVTSAQALRCASVPGTSSTPPGSRPPNCANHTSSALSSPLPEPRPPMSPTSRAVRMRDLRPLAPTPTASTGLVRAFGGTYLPCAHFSARSTIAEGIQPTRA